jgi:hypothetical protein
MENKYPGSVEQPEDELGPVMFMFNVPNHLFCLPEPEEVQRVLNDIAAAPSCPDFDAGCDGLECETCLQHQPELDTPEEHPCNYGPYDNCSPSCMCEGDCSIGPDPASYYDTQVGGSHYNDKPRDVAEFIIENNYGFAEGNIIKYAARHDVKNGAEDIKKIIHYAQFILETKYGIRPE